VILITGNTREKSEKKGRAHGAAGFIQKPFDPGEVLAEVATYFQ